MKFQEPTIMSANHLDSRTVSDMLNNVHEKFMIRRENAFDLLIKKYEKPTNSVLIDMNNFTAVEDNEHPCYDAVQSLDKNSICMEISREEEQELSEIFKIVRKQAKVNRNSTSDNDEAYYFFSKSGKRKLNNGAVKTISIKRRRTVETVPLIGPLSAKTLSKNKCSNNVSNRNCRVPLEHIKNIQPAKQNRHPPSRKRKGPIHKRSKSECLPINTKRTKKLKNSEKNDSQNVTNHKRTKSALTTLQNRSLKQRTSKVTNIYLKESKCDTAGKKKAVLKEKAASHPSHKRSKSCPSKLQTKTTAVLRIQPCRRCKQISGHISSENDFSKFKELFCLKDCSVVCEHVPNNILALYKCSPYLSEKTNSKCTNFQKEVKQSRTRCFKTYNDENSHKTEITVSSNYTETDSVKVGLCDQSSELPIFGKNFSFLGALDDTFVTLPKSKNSSFFCSALSLTYSPINRYVNKLFHIERWLR